MATTPALTNSAAMLSVPSDFPIFIALTAHHSFSSDLTVGHRNRCFYQYHNDTSSEIVCQKVCYCVGYHLDEYSDCGVQLSILIYKHSKRC